LQLFIQKTGATQGRSNSRRFSAFLSVQCNTTHGTEYKITCGVCLCVCVLVCALDFGVEYPENVKRYSLGVNGQPIANGIWGIDWSHDRWRHMTLKGQGRDLIIFAAQYLENGWI